MGFSNNVKKLDPAAKRLLFNARDSTADATRNTWASKAWRTLASGLPVAPTRRGA